MIRFILCITFMCCSVYASAQGTVALKKENLFLLPKVALDRDLSIGVRVSEERKSRDGSEATAASYTLKKNTPQELIYFFGGEIVSPESLKLKVNNISNNQVKVEVLVSTVSSSAGYASLRVEPLRKGSHWQSFSFDQSAAKWVMIKFIPVQDDVTISLVEIELRGHAGPPVSTYQFHESPAEAFDVLKKLKSSVNVNITAEETSLFEDAKDGSFDQWSFAEASLLSSGVVEKAQRQQYLQQIDTMEKQVKALLPSEGTDFERGEKLLLWLHGGAFTKGYVKYQTDVSLVLDERTFNCVSSATLYNILARRLGLDARGIEVPDHAFTILYDGTDHVDIETTTRRGFNPARNRAGLSEFERQTGFVYIPEKNRSKRREVGETGMVAITYYNHGVELSEKKKYAAALSYYFRALSLDPENKSAIKNALAVLANWSAELSTQGDFQRALSVLEVGMELAPEDKTLRHNNRVVWQHLIEKSVDAGEIDTALVQLRTAHEKTGDKSFLKMQSWVFLKRGEDMVKKKDWEGALVVAETGIQAVDESIKREIERWRLGVILRWSNMALDKKNYSEAVDILERGLGLGKRDYRIENNLGYITQEWGKHVAETEGAEAGRQLVLRLGKRFPQLSKVQRAGRGFSDREAREAIERGDYERALEVYRTALKDSPGDRHFSRNQQATWVQWASASMENRQWEKALAIYERAHGEHPNTHIFKQNIKYIVQEWGRDIAAEKGALEAEKLVSEIAARFPKITSLQRAGGDNIGRLIQELIEAKDFEKAESELINSRQAFSNSSKYKRLAFNLYFLWAEPSAESEDWQKVIAVYTRGHEKHPENRKIKQNLVASWHSLAKPLLDTQQWQAAMEVYEKGLKALPGNVSFSQNIRYCKSQLGVR